MRGINITSPKVKTIFQRNKRDTDTAKAQTRRVKPTQLIQFLPAPMLLLNPRNMVIVLKPNRRVETERKLKPRERNKER